MITERGRLEVNHDVFPSLVFKFCFGVTQMTNLKDECRDKVTRKENLSSSRSKGEKPVITPASLSALHLVQTSQPQVAASAGSSSGALSYSVGMENSEFLLEGE